MVVVPRKTRSKDKIYPNSAILRPILQGLQAQGKTVILSNGVFDLLHVGHVRSLEDARSRADFLVVGVNSDKSAEAIKGKGHPIMPVAERMEMLSAMWFVDYVTSFSEETADGLLEALGPDFYAKGTDYTLRTLPERATLKSIGAKAFIVGDKKGHSTRKMIQRIRKRKFS